MAGTSCAPHRRIVITSERYQLLGSRAKASAVRPGDERAQAALGPSSAEAIVSQRPGRLTGSDLKRQTARA